MLSWLFVAAFFVVWAANIASCFGGHSRSQHVAGVADDSAALTPRALSRTDAFERQASDELTTGWFQLGQPAAALDVWIVDSDDINAASLGDGRFVIWRGLRRLPPEARQAVYAHEFAHDQLHHSRKAGEMADVADWMGEVLGTFSGGDERTEATLKRWTGQLVMPHYSRDQELEADREAVRLLAQMGYAAPETVMCRAFRRIQGEVGEAGGGLFASHPSMSERIRRVADGGC